jgi:hypothetical protein
MYLFELSQNDEVNAILVAADRLEELHKSGKLKDNWPVEKLLTLINKYLQIIPDTQLVLTKDDLIKIISSDKSPFKKTIKNIQGDEVIFVGNPSKEAPESPPPEKSKEVVDKMAKKALKK